MLVSREGGIATQRVNELLMHRTGLGFGKEAARGAACGVVKLKRDPVVRNGVTTGRRTHFCWSVGFWMMVFSPSITCCFSWCDSIPATREALTPFGWRNGAEMDPQAHVTRFKAAKRAESLSLSPSAATVRYPKGIFIHSGGFASLFPSS